MEQPKAALVANCQKCYMYIVQVLHTLQEITVKPKEEQPMAALVGNCSQPFIAGVLAPAVH